MPCSCSKAKELLKQKADQRVAQSEMEQQRLDYLLQKAPSK